MWLLRRLVLILPALCAAVPLGDEPAVPLALPPPARAVDVDLHTSASAGLDPVAAREALRQRLTPPPANTIAATEGRVPLGHGFTRVGSVAVLEGDLSTVTARGTGFGIVDDNLAAVTSRFINAFGDDYDQVAVFLAFNDRLSTMSLAYQMPVRNDVKGLGIPLFDQSARFGSPSGRLETVLNMKRILLYGRDAANDPDNDLYSVWAQEAGHRWLVYFRYQRPGDAAPSDALLGRQKAHWSRGVEAGGSIMDGYTWRTNPDGTYTPVDRNKRYGVLDQYGMGLRAASEVPPFFILDEFLDAEGQTLSGPISLGGRYKARRINLTIDDIIRANGRRDPPNEPAAEDLRMGVVLVTAPGTSAEAVIGESFRIDNTRRLWDDFYNAAGGGRGKVCTDLMRPCRGPSFTYGAPTLSERTAQDAVVAPGDSFQLEVPVTNAGNEAGAAKVEPTAPGLAFDARSFDTGRLSPGQVSPLRLTGRVAPAAACGEITVDLSAAGRLGPSKGSMPLLVGLVRGPADDLESGTAENAWRVNPDGTDTARRGAWQLATPERTAAFDFVLQPAGALSGTRAFVTGAAAGQDGSDFDVDEGFTTLQSPPLSLATLRQPRLSYQVHFVAADFDREVLIPGADDHLRVLASVDGTTWTEIDRVTGMATSWQRRLVKLQDKLPAEALAAPELRLRFVAEDAGGVDNVVEAVIDDVTLWGEAPSCGAVLPGDDGGAPSPGMEPSAGMGGDGCACALPGTPESQPRGSLVILVGLLLLTTRVRRPPR